MKTPTGKPNTLSPQAARVLVRIFEARLADRPSPRWGQAEVEALAQLQERALLGRELRLTMAGLVIAASLAKATQKSPCLAA